MYGVGTHLSLQRNIYKECMARLPFLKRSKSLNIDRINIKFRNFVYLDTLFLAIRVLWCHRQYLGNSYSGFTVWKSLIRAVGIYQLTLTVLGALMD